MSFTMTVFTDVHNGDFNYNDFDCTNALKKLRKILDETASSDCYASLGDFADYLKYGDITFYRQAVDVCSEYGIQPYHPSVSSSGKIMYHVLGNHETAYVPKSQLEDYIPYVPGIGSCYVFKREGVLFLVIDANFDPTTRVDMPEIMRTTVRFILPEKQTEYLLSQASAIIDSSIKSIVILSHISCNVIEEASYIKLLSGLKAYGLPIDIFEGHFHTEQDGWVNDQSGAPLAKYHTLPAVTSGKGKFAKPNDKGGYRYYTLTFEDGCLADISKHLSGEIVLD